MCLFEVWVVFLKVLLIGGINIGRLQAGREYHLN